MRHDYDIGADLYKYWYIDCKYLRVLFRQVWLVSSSSIASTTFLSTIKTKTPPIELVNQTFINMKTIINYLHTFPWIKLINGIRRLSLIMILRKVNRLCRCRFPPQYIRKSTDSDHLRAGYRYFVSNKFRTKRQRWTTTRDTFIFCQTIKTKTIFPFFFLIIDN